MLPTILALAIEVPKTALAQEDFTHATAKHLAFNDSKTRLLERIGTGSQIHKRHTVISDFLEKRSTAQRNVIYKNQAPILAETVCKKALNQWGGDPKTLTHIISISCTGMMAPGIEFLLIDKLGLSNEIERLGINFMGCFGAFKGIAIAKALALESPDHRILIVCTELCSLHFQQDLKTDTLVANSLFADGSAAVVIGTHPKGHETPLFEIKTQKSAALKNSTELMTWEPGDHGYQMRLSASVPSHLEENISPFVHKLIGTDLSFDQCTWAIHPGGKAILEAITKACTLEKSQVAASWKVLNDYGNMSSSTFLFVLAEILKKPTSKKWTIGLGFGPGLSIEGVLLNNVAR